MIKNTTLTNVLALIFPVSIMAIKGLADVILVILMIIGFFELFKYKNNLFRQPPLRIFSIITTGYFLVVIISIIFSGKFLELIHFSSRELHFLFAPLVALALLKGNIRFHHLLLSIKAGLAVMGVLVLYQYSNGSIRPAWVMNADVYGNLMVMLLFLSIANIEKEQKNEYLITLFSATIGLSAIILSGTRGAWVSFILLLLVWVFLSFIKSRKLNFKVIIFLFVTLLTISLWLGFDETLKQRTLITFNEIQQWQNKSNASTSTGIRMTMYESGLAAAKENPLLGHGYRNTNQAAASFAEGDLQALIKSHNHLHNAYITNLVFGGVLALFAMLILLFLPVKILWDNFLNEPDPQFARMGLLLCIGYASFGVFNVLFGDVFMNAFYVFFLAIFLPRSFPVTNSRQIYNVHD